MEQDKKAKPQFGRVLQIGLTLTLLLGVLFSYNNCGLDVATNKKKKRGTDTESQATTVSTGNALPNGSNAGPIDDIVDTDDDDSDPIDDDPMDDPMDEPVINPVVMEEVEVGIKDYSQILESMSVLTGVDPERGDIMDVYEDVENQLPTDNDIKAFLAAHQVSITKLATEFCDELVDDGTLRSQVWVGFDFNSAANNAFVPNNRIIFIDQTTNRFWGGNVPSVGEDHNMVINELIDTLLVGENLNSSATTRNVVKGVCISVLASANVTLL